jgi:hypothetical protein
LSGVINVCHIYRNTPYAMPFVNTTIHKCISTFFDRLTHLSVFSAIFVSSYSPLRNDTLIGEILLQNAYTNQFYVTISSCWLCLNQSTTLHFSLFRFSLFLILAPWFIIFTFLLNRRLFFSCASISLSHDVMWCVIYKCYYIFFFFCRFIFSLLFLLQALYSANDFMETQRVILTVTVILLFSLGVLASLTGSFLFLKSFIQFFVKRIESLCLRSDFIVHFLFCFMRLFVS